MWKISYKEEEHWNTATHGLGVLFGIFGAVVLYRQTAGMDSVARFSAMVYSVSILLLFAASTLYHAVSDPRIKRRLRILDHISIYYLIAGTYTPVALILLRESSGWLFFWVVWGLALFGTVLKLFFTGRFEVFSLLLYLIMGWMIVIDLENLLEKLSTMETIWLGAGGACYTLGIFFYAVRRIPFNHFIWHLFVLGGAATHWLMVYGIISNA